MTKYAIYETHPLKGGRFKRVSEFFETAEEAIDRMDYGYYRGTKVMSVNGKEKKVIKYHKNYGSR